MRLVVGLVYVMMILGLVILILVILLLLVLMTLLHRLSVIPTTRAPRIPNAIIYCRNLMRSPAITTFTAWISRIARDPSLVIYILKILINILVMVYFILICVSVVA